MNYLNTLRDRLAKARAEVRDLSQQVARLSALEDELTALFAGKVGDYLGDFDAWLRDEDPEVVEYVRDLCQSLHGPRLQPFVFERMAERFWLDVYRDVQEEYAQAASFDRELGFRRYEDRRGF